MLVLNVIIQRKDDPNPVWNIPSGKIVNAGELQHAAVLENGMSTGKPSVAFRIDMPNGDCIMVQQSARQMVMLARIIEGKFPDLMED